MDLVIFERKTRIIKNKTRHALIAMKTTMNLSGIKHQLFSRLVWADMHKEIRKSITLRSVLYPICWVLRRLLDQAICETVNLIALYPLAAPALAVCVKTTLQIINKRKKHCTIFYFQLRNEKVNNMSKLNVWTRSSQYCLMKKKT